MSFNVLTFEEGSYVAGRVAHPKLRWAAAMVRDDGIWDDNREGKGAVVGS